MRKLPKRLRREAGYTLFEIMLVLGIIAVLVGSAIYMLGGAVGVAESQRAATDIKTLTTALGMYKVQTGSLPTTEQGLQALVSRPSGAGAPKRWREILDDLPTDPWGKPYDYRRPGKKNPRSYDLYSLGEDGVESEDDIGND